MPEKALNPTTSSATIRFDLAVSRNAPTVAEQQRRRRMYAIAGALIGLAVTFCINKLQLAATNLIIVALVSCTLCSSIALTRFRILVWGSGAFLCLATLAVGFTPLMTMLLKQVVVQDKLAPSDAIVVLTADVDQQGVPSPQGQRRLQQAFTLLKQRTAPYLVVTRLLPPKPSSLPFVKRQLHERRIQCLVEEVGPIDNTHDEALASAALARRRGWRRVIIVSDGSHMRRAKALFARVGLSSLASPCRNPLYDIDMPRTPRERYAAFHSWWYETKLFYDHKRRGWV